MDSSGVMTTCASPKMKNEDSLEVAKTSASPEMGKIAYLRCCENSVKSELRMPRRFPQICIYIYIYILWKLPQVQTLGKIDSLGFMKTSARPKM